MWNRSLLLILLLSGPVSAAEVYTITDGSSLAEGCHQALHATEPPAPGAFACLAYLRGVLDTMRHANALARLRLAQASGGRRGADLYCVPLDLRYGAAARIVRDHARAHRELVRESAERLALSALQAAFPCPRER